MPTTLDRDTTRQHLENFDLRSLFIEELGWDHGGTNTEATVAGRTFVLEAVAQKRGMVVYQYVADSGDAFPDHPTRQKIEKAIARIVREHLIVYASHDRNTLSWQWIKREPGQPDRPRQHIWHRDQPGEALIQKLEQLIFTLDEEEDMTIVEVSGRVRAAFDVEKVTRKFYERFKKEHYVFLGFIEGIENVADREWYASLMLNRMMFIYFIQKRGFLDGDPDYLCNRLQHMRARHGKDRFQTFYRLFLFAALNILEPIYTACLEAMRGFLDDLERSKRKHCPEKLKDFREVLEQITSHASERYFILKTIIVNNLYGVDIMEEAVEICKLRLFLKFVAQLESYDQIEPLPDVDFNVRAGNTLVGFTTLKEIQDAFCTTPDGQRRMLYAEDTAKLKRIEEDAEIADRAFLQFRQMQIERGMDASKFAEAKLELRQRLDDLRDE